MKKIILCVIMFFLLPSTVAFAQEEIPGMDEMYKAAESEELSSLGINGFEDSLNFSWQEFINIIPDLIEKNYFSPLKTLLLSAVIIIISSFLNSYSKDNNEIIELAGALGLSALFLPHMAALVTQVTNVCQGIMVFLLAAIPVYAALHIASGNAALGTTMGGVSVLAANMLSQLINNLVIPLISVFMGLSLSAAFSHINIKGISESVYKLIKWLLVFSVTLFSGVLSVQSAISGTADAATAKTVKLIASSAIPIVGSAFGEGVAAVQNSIKLLKSGTSAFGIIAVLCIFAPPVIKCLLWIVSCQISVIISDIFAASKIKEFLNVLLITLKIIMAILLSLCIISLVTAAISLFSGA